MKSEPTYIPMQLLLLWLVVVVVVDGAVVVVVVIVDLIILALKSNDFSMGKIYKKDGIEKR